LLATHFDGEDRLDAHASGRAVDRIGPSSDLRRAVTENIYHISEIG
jgi:hypothetical protein